MNNFIVLFGLGLGILGCYFLVRGFFAKKLKDIIGEFQIGRLLGNLYVARSLIAQKWDVICGFILSAFGFLFQFLGLAFFDNEKTASNPQLNSRLAGLGTLITTIIIVGFGTNTVSKKLKRREGKKFVKEVKEIAQHIDSNGVIKSDDQGFIEEICDLLLVPRKKEENIESLKNKIKKKLKY